MKDKFPESQVLLREVEKGVFVVVSVVKVSNFDSKLVGATSLRPKTRLVVKPNV